MKILLVRDRNVLNTNWLVLYANALAARGYEIVIAADTYHKLGKLPKGGTLHPHIRVVNLNAPTKNRYVNLWRRIREKLPFGSALRYNRLIRTEKPDAIVCYFPKDLFHVVRWQRHDIPIVQMLHGTREMILGKYLKKNPLSRWWAFRAFHRVDVWQVLLPSFVPEISALFPDKQCFVIANAVQQISEADAVDLSQEKKKIIYLARMEKEIKRPHLLVEAFGRIAADFPGWTVDLWGIRKYPEYDAELEKTALHYGVQNRVKLKGYTTDVPSVYRSADIHAFPSAAEGFSLALADGMAYGLPSLGFRSSPSVSEMIVDDQNGLLADDLDDFTAKLKRLMSDQTLRRRLGGRARTDMKAYAPEMIIDQWEALFRCLRRGNEKKKMLTSKRRS